MTALLHKLHARLGDFWWYSLIMFVALRCGDVINAVVGLWLVPKYVPQEELGAVLPLTQFATILGFPISILVLVFTKYLAQFKTKGELGKVKSLLMWFLGFVMAASLLSIVLSKFMLPALFERIRIQDGSLTLLIIATGIIGTIAPVFNNALQGLKKFKTITFLNLIGAPVRLVSMLLLLPIRALSGYMAAQLVPAIVAIVTSAISIRKDINKSVVSVPFWKDDWKPMLRYMLWIAISAIPGQIFVLLQTLIIRQRLPEVESAAYYMISRFSELVSYVSATLIFVMFPIVVEAHARGRENRKIMHQMQLGTSAFSLSCAAVLYFGGAYILDLLPTSRPYVGYSTDMALLAIALMLQYMWGNFTSFETANNRFRYVFYSIPLTILQTLILVCFSGYTYFYGLLPTYVVDWMGSWHLATLRNLIIFLIIVNGLKVVCSYIDLYVTGRKVNPVHH